MGRPGASSRSLSLGITITVSADFLNISKPFSAFLCLRMPSTVKGRVTIPTVRAPVFFATSATIGAAPVPVPPPRPQVTKTMSALSMASRKVRSSSRAACSPTEGSFPAPRPFVISRPIRIFLLALHFFRSWASVLTAMSSLPSTPTSMRRLMALHPAPPTPITLICA